MHDNHARSGSALWGLAILLSSLLLAFWVAWSLVSALPTEALHTLSPWALAWQCLPATMAIAYYLGLLASGWWWTNGLQCSNARVMCWTGLGALFLTISLSETVHASIPLVLAIALPALTWCFFIESRHASQTKRGMNLSAGHFSLIDAFWIRFLLGLSLSVGCSPYLYDAGVSLAGSSVAETPDTSTVSVLEPSSDLQLEPNPSGSGTATRPSTPVSIPADLEAIRLETRQATLAIRNSRTSSAGSGCWLRLHDGRLRILTAAHVVAGSREVTVEWMPEIGKLPLVRTAAVEAIDDSSDLALLRLVGPTPDPQPYALQLADEPPADESLAWGISYRAAPQCLPIRQRLIKRPGDRLPLLAWEADLGGVPGESGGPLVVPAGLIGIRSGTEGDHSYFAHLNSLRSLLKNAGVLKQ